MNSTNEKTMESVPSMMETQFFGKVSEDSEKHNECAIMGLIKNQMYVLEDELKDAKLRYADVALEEENWSGKYERKMACKVLEGQIAILSKLQNDLEDMLTPLHKEMAMAV